MTSLAVPTDDEVKLRAAQLRSMPMTRMLDYGMDYWDAVHLTSSSAAEPWEDVASRLAVAQRTRARAAAERGDRETAVDCYRRACATFVFAQMAHNEDTERKRSLYEAMSHAYQEAADLDELLEVERLGVPFRDSTCNAWLVRARGEVVGPTIVIVGGQSGWGPAFHHQAAALVRRGLSAVLLEAPGQGESRMMHGIHLDRAVHEAFSATADAVNQHTGSSTRFGVWGNSFGGLLAAHAAIHDDRFAACLINGAPSRPTPSPFRTASEQSRALLGARDEGQVASGLRSLWIDPEADRISGSLLVLHGGRDPLITIEQQKPFLGLAESSEIHTWDDGEHTIYNRAAERNEFAGDWFRARLG